MHATYYRTRRGHRAVRGGDEAAGDAHGDPQLLSRPPADSWGDAGAAEKGRDPGARDLGREGPILEPGAGRAAPPLGPEPPSRRAPAGREPLGRGRPPTGGERPPPRLPALAPYRPSALTA